MTKRKVTRKKTTKRKTPKRRVTKRKVGKNYVVKATVVMKSKKLTKSDADALKISTKRKVKDAVVKVTKV